MKYENIVLSGINDGQYDQLMVTPTDTARRVLIDEWGLLDVVGGSASDVEIKDDGILSITEGEVTQVNVREGGFMRIHGDMQRNIIVNDVKVNGGTVYADSGCKIKNLQINAGGDVTADGIFLSGTVNVNTSGSLVIEKMYGMLDKMSVYSDAYLSLTNATIDTLDFKAGARYRFDTNTNTISSGTNEYGAFSVVNGEARSLVIGKDCVVSGRFEKGGASNGGRMITSNAHNISWGGGAGVEFVGGSNVHGSGLLQSDGGYLVANTEQVLSGGCSWFNNGTTGEWLVSGRTATNLYLPDKSLFTIYQSGGIQGAWVGSGGKILVATSSGTVTGAVLDAGGGIVYYAKKGEAEKVSLDLTMNYGAYIICDTSISLKGSAMYLTPKRVVTSTGEITYVSNGEASISSGLASGLILGESSYLTVLGGHSGSLLEVLGGAVLEASGGYIENSIVASGGLLYVSGATAENPEDALDGSAFKNVIEGGGRVIVGSNGICESGTLLNLASQLILNGGEAKDTIVSGGLQVIYSGGTANRVIVSDEGSQFIRTGGSVNSTTVKTGGHVIAESGTKVVDVRVSSGGTLTLQGSAYADKVLMEGNSFFYFDTDATILNGSYGHEFSIQENVASGLQIFNSCYLRVTENGTALNTNILAGGKLEVYGVTSGTLLTWGTINAYGNAVLNKTEVSSHGEFTLTGNAVASGTVVAGSATMTLKERNVAVDTRIYDATQVVGTQAVAINTVVTRGTQIVNGKASATELFDGGVQYVGKNAVTENTIVHYGGSALYAGGASASFLMLESGALFSAGTDMTVISGTNIKGAFSIENGVATNIFIENGGAFFVLSGHAAHGAWIGHSARLEVAGTVSDLMIDAYGSGTLTHGASARNVVLNSAGSLVLDGRVQVSGLDNTAGGKLILTTDSNVDGTNSLGAFSLKNNIASGFELLSGSELYVRDYAKVFHSVVGSQSLLQGGGTFEDIIATDGGKLTLTVGASASKVAVNYGGWLIAENTGKISNLAIDKSGYFSVSTAVTISGGKQNSAEYGTTDFSIINGEATGFKLFEYQKLSIVNGTKATGIIVNGGAFAVAGTATDTDVKSGIMSMTSGGKAQNVNVGGDGWLKVDGAGVLDKVSIEEGGKLSISTDATLTNGKNILGDIAIINHSANNFLLVEGSELDVKLGGFATNTYVSGGALLVAGTVNTVVQSGGLLRVHDHGLIADVDATAGRILVESGGSGYNAKLVGGSMDITSGGIWNTASLTMGAQVHVDGTLNSARVEQGTIWMYKGAAGADTALGSLATLHVSGGTLTRTSLAYGAKMYVNGYNDNCYITSTIVNSGAEVEVHAGFVHEIQIVGGSLNQSGGSVTSATVSSGGAMQIRNGNVASALVKDAVLIVSGGAGEYVKADIGGRVSAVGNAVLNQISIYYGGKFYLSGGAMVVSGVISKGGEMRISENGKTKDMVLSGGSQFVGGSNALVDFTRMVGGAVQTLTGGASATMTSISGGAVQQIRDGAKASGTTLVGGSQIVFDGGFTDALAISGGGYARLESGGSADNVIASNGSIVVSGGASVNNIQVKTNAALYLSGGASVQSLQTFERSVVVTDTDATIVYGVGVFGNFSINKKIATAMYLYKNCEFTVLADGQAFTTTVDEGASFTVEGRAVENWLRENSKVVVTGATGILEQTTAASGSVILVDNHGRASLLDMTAANLTVTGGATADKIVMSPGSTFTVGKDAAVTTVTMVGGTAKIEADGAVYGFIVNAFLNETHDVVTASTVTVGGTVDGFSLSNSFLIMENGANVLNIQAIGSIITVGTGATLSQLQMDATNITVATGGKLDDIDQYGNITLASGSYANALRATSGTLAIEGAAILDNLSMNGATVTLTTDATVYHATNYDRTSGSIVDGTVRNWMVSNDGYLAVLEKDYAENVRISSGTVDLSGNSLLTRVEEGGVFNVFDTGTAEDVTMVGNAVMNVHGSASNVKVSSGLHALYGQETKLQVYGGETEVAGGKVYDAAIAGGIVHVYDGGTMTKVRLENAGALNIYDNSGAVKELTVVGAAALSLSTAANVYGVNDFGAFSVAKGVATNLFFGNGGALIVQSGHSAVHAHIGSGGTMSVFGTVKDSTVMAHGVMVLKDFTTANNILVEGDGEIKLGFNSKVDTIVLQAGASFSGDTSSELIKGTHQYGTFSISFRNAYNLLLEGNDCLFTVQYAGSANNTIVQNGGQLAITGRGAVGNYTIIRNKGTEVVGSIDNIVAESNNTSIYYGGVQYVLGMGIANRAVVNSGGIQIVNENGTAYNTTVANGGNQQLNKAGKVEGTVVKSGGMFTITGGSATRIKMEAGAQINANTDGTLTNGTNSLGAFSLINNVASNFLIEGTAAQLSVLTGSAMKTTVRDGGTLQLYTSGYAKDVLLGSGGKLHMANGGTAIDVIQQGGAALQIDDMDRVTLRGKNDKGAFFITSNAADNLIVENGGHFGMRAGTLTNSFFGENTKLEAVKGRVENVSLSKTTTLVLTTDATFVNCTINGVAFAVDGGVAKSMTLSGKESSLTVQAGHEVQSSTIVNGATLTLKNTASATNITIAGGGMLDMNAGAKAENVTLGNGALFALGDVAKLTISGTNSGGSFSIKTGVVEKLIMNAGCSISVSSASFVDATLNAGSKVTAISYSSELSFSGVTTLATSVKGATFTGTVIFAIDQFFGSCNAMIESFSKVKSDATVVRVRGDQTVGKYVLANYWEPNTVLTLKSMTGDVIGTLSDTNRVVESQGKRYTLNIADGKVSFEVANIGSELWFGNFNGGSSEVAMVNRYLGDVSIRSNGTSNYLGKAAGNWEVVGIGDFDGNGSDDVLLRDSSTGVVAGWIVKDNQYVQAFGAGQAGDPWKVIGIGDFNGDGTDDILFQDMVAGGVVTWTMKNGSYLKADGAGYVGGDWSIGGIGDFNGDGVDDVLLQDSVTGHVAYWTMADGKYSGVGGIGTVIDQWQIVGIGDFNGDGTDDVLLWNEADGNVASWIVRDGTYSEVTSVGFVGADWSIAGIGDFNNDGTDDVALRLGDTDEVFAWIVEDGKYKDAVRLA